MEKIKSLIQPLRTAQALALFLLQITTLFTAGLMLWNFFNQFLPQWAAGIMTGAGAWFTGQVIDGLLDKILPVAASPHKPGTRREKAFVWIIRFLALTLLIVSGTLSWWAMPEISRAAIAEPENSQILETVTNVNASVALTLKDKNAEIKEAERAVEQARKDGKALIQSAINSHPEAARLLKSGNTWVKTAPQLSAWRSRVAQAERKAAKMEEQAREYVRILHNEKNGLIAARTAQSDSMNTALTTLALNREKRYEARMNRYTNVLYLFDLAWMGIVIVISTLLFLVDGHTVRQTKSGMGLIFQAVDARGQQFIEWIERFLLPRQKQVRSAPRPDVFGVAPGLVPASGEMEAARLIEALRAKVDRMEGEFQKGGNAKQGVQISPPSDGEKRGYKSGVQKMPVFSPRGETYKGSAQDKLRRKIARYKRLAAADQLGEKGRKTLERMEHEYKKMKGTK